MTPSQKVKEPYSFLFSSLPILWRSRARSEPSAFQRRILDATLQKSMTIDKKIHCLRAFLPSFFSIPTSFASIALKWSQSLIEVAFECIHYDPLIMQLKELAGSTHVCFLKKLPFWCELPILGNVMLLLLRTQKEAPIVFFKAKLDANSHHFTYFSRKHAGSKQVAPIILLRQNGELTSKRQLFQEAHMGASCVLPSVASLTGRTV